MGNLYGVVDLQMHCTRTYSDHIGNLESNSNGGMSPGDKMLLLLYTQALSTVATAQ